MGKNNSINRNFYYFVVGYDKHNDLKFMLHSKGEKMTEEKITIIDYIVGIPFTIIYLVVSIGATILMIIKKKREKK